MKNFPSQKIPNETDKETPESRQEGERRKILHPLRDDDEKARCEWDFSLSTLVSSSGTNNALGIVSDTIGAIEFDQSDSFLATGGIARKIRIYSLKSLLPASCDIEAGGQDISRGGYTLLTHANACEFYMCTPAKLSSLRWKPGFGGGILGSGDYDGVVMEYDLEKRVPVFERDEHGGRRVWSMDYSRIVPVVGASGSDDGTMQIWDPRCDGGSNNCLAEVQPSQTKSPVCCVEFSPFDGFLVAVGCADRKAYGYDIRRTSEPIFVLDGHQKAVAYVRFLDNRTIVTSAIDGSLKTWNIQDQTSSSTIRTFIGHVNSRRFVGLSVWRSGGLLCCGSEDNRVVVYDQRWGDPVWIQEFEPPSGGCNTTTTTTTSSQGFVSSVCWRQAGEDRCTLVAGGSEGVLQVFSGRRKR